MNGRQNRRILLAAACSLLFLWTHSATAQYRYNDPGGGDPPEVSDSCPGAARVVQVKDNFFDPAELRIQVGECVEWRKETSGLHNVHAPGVFQCSTSCDPNPDDPSDPAGEPTTEPWTVAVTFEKAGTLDYRCDEHADQGMLGSVIVEEEEDQPGTLQFTQSNYSASEGGGNATIAVSRSGGTSGAVSVQYNTSDGTATAGLDYTAVSGTLNWADGQGGNKSFNVPLLDDDLQEGNETVNLALSNPTGGATLGARSTAVLTIVDDDQGPAAGTIQFVFGSFSVPENRSEGEIRVSRVGGTTGAVSIQYSTGDVTATAGSDYQSTSGTLNWDNGEGGEKSFFVPILNDTQVEGMELVDLRLSNPTGGAVLGSPRFAGLAILDDDAQPVPLTLGEVLCDEFRLEGLLERLEIDSPNTGKVPGLNLSFTENGDFSGISYTGNGPGTAEHHLAFSTNPEETTLLRNPARLQLFSVSASQNQLNADLVGSGHSDELRIFLNTTLSNNPDPAVLLTVDNVLNSGGKPTDAKPGRGLTPLVFNCHRKFTPVDVHVFRVLQKIARADADGATAYKLAIFRGDAPDLYRVNVLPVGPDGRNLGRLAVEVEIAFDGSGALDRAVLRVMDRCSDNQVRNCTSVTAHTELMLVKPLISGEFWPATDDRVFTDGTQGDGIPERQVDLEALLADTTWQRPLGQ